jgi:protein TonB
VPRKKSSLKWLLLPLFLILFLVAAIAVGGYFFLRSRFQKLVNQTPPISTAQQSVPETVAPVDTATIAPVTETTVPAIDTAAISTSTAAIDSTYTAAIDTSTAVPVTESVAPPPTETVAPKVIAKPKVVPPKPPKPKKEKVVVAPPPPEREEPKAPAVSEGDLVSLNDSGVHAPQPRQLTDAKYPVRARMAGTRGTVRLSLLIGIDGHVENVRVSQSSGSDLLDNSAKLAAKSSTYTPATKDGVRVRVWISKEYKFGN